MKLGGRRRQAPAGTFLERFLAGSTASGMAAAGALEVVFAGEALAAAVFAAGLGVAAFDAAFGGFTAVADLPPDPAAGLFEAVGPSVAYSSFALSQCSLSLPEG